MTVQTLIGFLAVAFLVIDIFGAVFAYKLSRKRGSSKLSSAIEAVALFITFVLCSIAVLAIAARA